MEENKIQEAQLANKTYVLFVKDDEKNRKYKVQKRL